VLALKVLAFMTSPTWACQLAGTSLSAEARAEIELSCMRAEKAAAEAAKEMTQTAAVADAKNLSAYAEIATQVAKAIGIAAKELGVAVNDFVTTPAGILTVTVILMKVFGKLFALVFVAIFVNIVVWGVLKRIWFVETDQTVEVSYLLFFKKTIQVKEMITYRQATDGQVFISFILIVISIAPLVLIPIYS
jgi:hypothetical protein